MFAQNFIKLSAAIHELSYGQRKKLSDDDENKSAIASTGCNKNNNDNARETDHLYGTYKQSPADRDTL